MACKLDRARHQTRSRADVGKEVSGEENLLDCMDVIRPGGWSLLSVHGHPQLYRSRKRLEPFAGQTNLRVGTAVGCRRSWQSRTERQDLEVDLGASHNIIISRTQLESICRAGERCGRVMVREGCRHCL